MISEESGYCLVLSGGGAKGVYYIGVWRALEELGIKIDAFIGNSIGAIVAGFLAESKGRELQQIGKELGIEFILNIPEDLVEDGQFKLSGKNLKSFREFYRNIFSRKGLDTSPLRRMLEDNLSEEALRGSAKDFGVVAYNFSDKRPLEIFLEDMKEGEVLDYIMASSAFPGFDSPKIGGKTFIDGGVYDNMPYGMARRRGYKKIIVVDISGLGVNRPLNIEGSNTVYIKNSIDMGGVLDFSREFIDNFTQLGYLDTLKTFNYLEGEAYFVKPDPVKEAQFKQELASKDLPGKLTFYARDELGLDTEAYPQVFQVLLPRYCRYKQDRLALFLDCAAFVTALERIKLWTYEDLVLAIAREAKALEESVQTLNPQKRKEIVALIRSEYAEPKLIKRPLYYYFLARRFLKGKAFAFVRHLLFELYPELPAGLSYVEILQPLLLPFNKKT